MKDSKGTFVVTRLRLVVVASVVAVAADASVGPLGGFGHFWPFPVLGAFSLVQIGLIAWAAVGAWRGDPPQVEWQTIKAALGLGRQGQQR